MERRFVLEFERPIYELSDQLDALVDRARASAVDLTDEIEALKRKIEALRGETYANLSEWERIQIARHPLRPYALDYIGRIFTEFQELHGDRLYADDRSMVCGIANLDGAPVAIIGQQKGRSVKENIERNFGMQNPEGYRKALRLMKLAERFGMAIVTIVDTAGAFPGIESEERHVAEAIAVNLREMMLIGSPIVSVFIGEGGSGGALGIAVADRVLILENAYYSVISPEGCAAILWNDRSKSAEAAKALRLSTKKLTEFHIVDEVLVEPIGGAHNDCDGMASCIKSAILRHLKDLLKLQRSELLDGRYKRFRKLGVFGPMVEISPIGMAERAGKCDR
jgi:acetyl-CoA carboxylase carboxyl transferase subunit alpha